MGEASVQLNPVSKNSSDRTTQLAAEIQGLRADLDRLVDTFERRARETADVRLQVRRHPVSALLVVLGTAALIGGGAVLLVSRHRRLAHTMERLRRQAISRIVEEPDRVAASEPGLGAKLLTAAGTTSISTLARALVARAVGSRNSSR